MNKNGEEHAHKTPIASTYDQTNIQRDEDKSEGCLSVTGIKLDQILEIGTLSSGPLIYLLILIDSHNKDENRDITEAEYSLRSSSEQEANTSTCGNSDIFTHPPYGSQNNHKPVWEGKNLVRIKLSDLEAGATVCGFCSVLYQGIKYHQNSWTLALAKSPWIGSNPAKGSSEFGQIAQTQELHQFTHGKEFDESKIYISIVYPGDIMLTADVEVLDDLRGLRTPYFKKLISIEFYTASGRSTCFPPLNSAHQSGQGFGNLAWSLEANLNG